MRSTRRPPPRLPWDDGRPFRGLSAGWLVKLAEVVHARLNGRQAAVLPPPPTLEPLALPAGYLETADLGSGWTMQAADGDRALIEKLRPRMGRCPHGDPFTLLRPAVVQVYRQTYGRKVTKAESVFDAAVYHLAPGDAERFMSKQRKLLAGPCSKHQVLATGPGAAGDDALILRSANPPAGDGGTTAWIRVGDRVVWLHVTPLPFPKGATPVPGGATSWMTATAKKAVDRLQAAQ